jgi:hypothetical protein
MYENPTLLAELRKALALLAELWKPLALPAALLEDSGHAFQKGQPFLASGPSGPGRSCRRAEKGTCDFADAAKLPYKMMQHILLVVKPVGFQNWALAVRNYHKDNTLVQNVAAIGTDGMGRKNKPFNKMGFSPQQWAKILNVKMPLDPNTMDTRADRSCSFNKNKGS